MEELFGSIVVLVLFGIAMMMGQWYELEKKRKVRRKRERELLHEMEMDRAVRLGRALEREATVARIRESLRQWSPIEWPEAEVVAPVTRRPRKYGVRG